MTFRMMRIFFIDHDGLIRRHLFHWWCHAHEDCLNIKIIILFLALSSPIILISTDVHFRDRSRWLYFNRYSLFSIGSGDWSSDISERCLDDMDMQIIRRFLLIDQNPFSSIERWRTISTLEDFLFDDQHWNRPIFERNLSLDL